MVTFYGGTQVRDLDLNVGGLIGLHHHRAVEHRLGTEITRRTVDDPGLRGTHRGGVGRLGGRHTVLGRLQRDRVIAGDLLALRVGPQQQIAARGQRRSRQEEHQADADEPALAESPVIRFLGGFPFCEILAGVRCRFLRRLIGSGVVLVVGGVQPAGASISFHPLSPELFELVTEYLTPSGPTTSPLDGL